MSECTCEPCTYSSSHWQWPYGADCCMGYGIESFDYDCPFPAHAELAVKQHGPRTPREETT